MRRDVAPQISENLGRHPTKALKRLASPLAAARRTVQLKSKVIGEGPRAYATLAVWNGLLPYCRRDTGEMLCSQRRLADTAGVARIRPGAGRPALPTCPALRREAGSARL